MDTTSLFTSALQLPDPWMVSGVEFRDGADGKRELHITIGFQTGSHFHCPENRCSEKTCPAHDARERVWRHLDFLQYKAFIHAGVPRVDWLECIRQSDEGRMTWDWRPTMADPRHPRHCDEAFKRQIVQSYENGKPSRKTGAGHDIARSTPRRWVQGIRNSGSTRAADNRTPGRNEPIGPGRRVGGCGRFLGDDHAAIPWL